MQHADYVLQHTLPCEACKEMPVGNLCADRVSYGGIDLPQTRAALSVALPTHVYIRKSLLLSIFNTHKLMLIYHALLHVCNVGRLF